MHSSVLRHSNMVNPRLLDRRVKSIISRLRFGSSSSAQGLLEILGRNNFFSSFAKECSLHLVIVKIPDAVMKTGSSTNTKVIYMRLFCLLAISISVILVSGTFMSELVTCPIRNTLAATK